MDCGLIVTEWPGSDHARWGQAERSVVIVSLWTGISSCVYLSYVYNIRCLYFLRTSWLIMATLRSRCGHYIFALWFLCSIFLSFFPRLISAVGDWMSTILPHMVWPLCEFRMPVWNVLHVARWNTGRKKSSSRHHRTTLSGCIFATKACIDNRKKNCETAIPPLHVLIIRWTLAH